MATGRLPIYMMTFENNSLVRKFAAIFSSVTDNASTHVPAQIVAVVLVALEGFGQPPGAAVIGDLGVDD